MFELNVLARHDTIHGLGGSDARLIMEGKGQVLWEEMTGRTPKRDFSDNLAVEVGNATETLSINWFGKQSGFKVFHDKDVLTHEIFQKFEKVDTDRGTIGIVHPIHKWMVASLDGFAWDHNISEYVLIESKHTNEFFGKNPQGIVKLYYAQLQFYMEVTGIHQIWVSIIIGNGNYDKVLVEYDAAYCAVMIQAISDFWKCILDDTPPAGDAPVVEEPVKTVMRNPAAPVIVDMAKSKSGNLWAASAADYLKYKDSAKTLKTAQDTMKELMGEADEVFGNGVRIKLSKAGKRLFTVYEEEEVEGDDQENEMNEFEKGASNG